MANYQTLALASGVYPSIALRQAASALHKSAPQPTQKGSACYFQFLLEFGGAVAVIAGPRLGAVLIAALAAVVGVLHAGEIEIFFPVGPFLLKRSRAIADFDPARALIVTEARFAHVAEVFSLGERALAEGFIFDGFEQVRFTAGFDTGTDEISHSWLDVGNSIADGGLWQRLKAASFARRVTAHLKVCPETIPL